MGPRCAGREKRVVAIDCSRQSGSRLANFRIGSLSARGKKRNVFSNKIARRLITSGAVGACLQCFFGAANLWRPTRLEPGEHRHVGLNLARRIALWGGQNVRAKRACALGQNIAAGWARSAGLRVSSVDLPGFQRHGWISTSHQNPLAAAGHVVQCFPASLSLV